MLAETQLLEKIDVLVHDLSPEYRLRLIQRITETLIPSSVADESRPLKYGKYKGGKMSTLVDFAVAEWRPTERELNGG